MTPGQTIRENFRALPSVQLKKWYPLEVEHGGRKAQFFAAQYRTSNGRVQAALSLIRICMGKLLASDPKPQPIVLTFRLTGQDRLVEEGLPHVASADQVSAWRNAGFPL